MHLRGRKADVENLFGSKYFTFELEDWMLVESTARERLQKLWGVSSLKGFGLDKMPAGVTAAGGILMYLDMTQHLQTGHIQHLSRIEEDKYVWLDKFTVRNLELTGGQREDSRSLFDIIDRTITPMGGRMLHRWMAFPLKQVRLIRNRQTVVEHLFKQPEARETISESLAQVGDLERIVSKISTGRIGPREMVQLARALRAIVPIKRVCEEARDNAYLSLLGEELDACSEMRMRIEREINPDPPLAQGRPNIIARGVDVELDELRAIQADGKDYLLQIQQREIERTGIASLKIGFNNVFGYYLEVRRIRARENNRHTTDRLFVRFTEQRQQHS